MRPMEIDVYNLYKITGGLQSVPQHNTQHIIDFDME